MVHQTLIIGGGPAGLTAAIYAGRAGLNPLVIMGPEPGGQLTTTTEVENYPGFAHPILGPQLMADMESQAKACGATLEHDIIMRVDLSEQPLRCWGEHGKNYESHTMILATGAEAKRLGLPSEGHYWGYGVSSCAVCDGFFFKGKDVAVVGGGNTAVEDALFLARLARQVTLVHRRHQLRAEKILQQRLFEASNVEIKWDHALHSVIGEEAPSRHVTHAKIQNVKTGDLRELQVSGVFIAIGHTPRTKPFEGWLKLDAAGYVDTPSVHTSIPGVFVAGDVRDAVYRQAVTAAGEGCMAALEAERFLILRGN